MPKKYDVTPEQFLAAWQSSQSAQEVADKLGMPKPIVLARATNYRKAGVNLKPMRRKRKGLDVPALNAYLARVSEVK